MEHRDEIILRKVLSEIKIAETMMAERSFLEFDTSTPQHLS